MRRLHAATIFVLVALSLSADVFAEESSDMSVPAESAAPADAGMQGEQKSLDPANGTAAKPPSRAELRAKVRSYRLEQMELIRQQMTHTPLGKDVPN